MKASIKHIKQYECLDQIKSTIMKSTPKTQHKLSYTRSEILIKSNYSEPQPKHKVKHGSLQKFKQINYNMILNKLLTISNANKFMSFASKFVSRAILQCQQQPNRFNCGDSALNSKNSNSNLFGLIYDGMFIRKLAQFSPKPLEVIKYFQPHLRINKKTVKEYKRWLKREIQAPSQQLQHQQGHNQYDIFYQVTQETQQQRQTRLMGYSKSKNKQRNAKKEETCQLKQNKILFSQHIKSNRKSMQIFKKIIQQQQETKKTNRKKQEKEQKQNLKRNKLRESLIAKYQQKPLIVQLTQQHKSNLTQIQRQILKNYPNIKYLAEYSEKEIKRDTDEQKGQEKKIQQFKIDQYQKVPIKDEQDRIKECLIIQKLGQWSGYNILKVTFEFQDYWGWWPCVGHTWAVEQALFITQSHSQHNIENGGQKQKSEQLKCRMIADNSIKIYLRDKNLWK